jgi:phage-related protein
MNDVGHVIKVAFVDSFHAAESVVGWFVGLFEKHWREIVAVLAPFIGLPLEIIHHWSSIVHFFEKLWHDIEHAFEDGWHAVSGFVTDLWHDVTGFFSKGIHAVTGVVSKFWSDEVRGFSRLWHDITHVVTELWHDVSSFFNRGINAVVHLVTAFFHREVAGFENLWHDVSHVVTELWNDLGRLSRAGINAIVHLVTSFVNREISGFENLWHSLSHIVTQLWNDVSGFFSSGIDNVVHIVSGLTGKVIGVFTRLPGQITGALSGLSDVILAPFKYAFNGIAGIWNSTVGSLSFHIPSWVPGLGNKGFSMPKIPTFAKGGKMFLDGMALVGESGPELVYLPGGSHVAPLGKRHIDLKSATANMMMAGSASHFSTPLHTGQPLEHQRSREETDRLIRALHAHERHLKEIINAIHDIAPELADELDGLAKRVRHSARTSVRSRGH